ncbi:phosphoribosyl-AMP cyclohydrolase [Candidatus Hodgkinia cicadicola]
MSDFFSGELLTLAYINALCLRLSFVTGIAHYYSRRRARVWLKGAISGGVHKLVDMFSDCDSDSLMFSVVVLGAGCGCHTLRPSCFYKGLLLGLH